MSERKISYIFRPLVSAVGFVVLFYVFLVAKGREASFTKIVLVGSWFIIGITVIAVLQFIRKKEFGWLGSVLGVFGVAMLIAVVMLSVKTGSL